MISSSCVGLSPAHSQADVLICMKVTIIFLTDTITHTSHIPHFIIFNSINYVLYEVYKEVTYCYGSGKRLTQNGDTSTQFGL